MGDKPASAEKARREKRLAEALRANLKRRKAAARTVFEAETDASAKEPASGAKATKKPPG